MGKKYKFKDTQRQAQRDLWLFTGVSVMLVLLLVVFSLWQARWDINVLLPGYGVWTKDEYFGVDVWMHLRYVLNEAGELVKVTNGTNTHYTLNNVGELVKVTKNATFDIGVLATAAIVQTIAFIIYLNERTRRLLSKATDVAYVMMLKIIGKFKSLQADNDFREMVKELDLKEKKDTWKLLAGLKFENHLQKESKKVLFERTEHPDTSTGKANRKHWSKRTLKFVKKEEKLKEQITDKWIDKHIKHINFRYPRITTTMILTGNTSVKISRMAIEDVKRIKSKETTRRIITSIILLLFIAVLGSIVSLTFQYDIWKAFKDVLVYMIAVVFSFVWAVMSSNDIHKSRELELEDRLGYIQKFVGRDEINKIKDEVTSDTYRKSEIEKMKLQSEIDDLKKSVQELE